MILVTTVMDIVDSNRRMTVHDVCDVTSYSYGTVQRVLTEEGQCEMDILLMTTCRSLWMCGRKYLNCYRPKGDTFLDRIVTTDKT